MPEPPEGYEWSVYLEKRLNMLSPVGWHAKEVDEPGGNTLYLTKENMEAEGSFSTGLVASIVQDVEASTGMKPSEYAVALFESVREKYYVLSRNELVRTTPFIQNMDYLLKIEDENGNVFFAKYVLVCNDVTSSIHIIFFQSLEKDWNSEWSTGEILIDNLIIDDSV